MKEEPNMELARKLIWARIDMEKFRASVRDKIPAYTRREKKRLAYRYEGTARIKDQNPDHYFENGFTL
jgi:hypothetical protein